jgi:hypothetical protein
METWRYGDMKKETGKMEAQAIFLNPFTVCSLCERKFAASSREESGSGKIIQTQTGPDPQHFMGEGGGVPIF